MSVVLDKSYAFALRIVKLCRYLENEQREFVLSKQLLRSGTSVGANVEEATGAQSAKDFIHKMSIAYKEARESSYWIRLLHDSDILNKTEFDSMHRDCEELLRIIGSICKTSREKLGIRS